MDIIVTAPVALRATAQAAKDNREALLKRYAPAYVQKAMQIERYAMGKPEIAQHAAAKGKQNDTIPLLREITEGGIEAALWELAKEHNVGLRAELRDIPIRQETVEVFNELDIDPYRLDSYGSWLCFVNNGAEVLMELRRQGYTEAAVIGYTTKDKKRLLYYSGVERFIIPPERYLDK